MAGAADNGTSYEVTCPHCGKSFVAEPLLGATPRHQGFKCPHCRLFVALDRVDELRQAEAAG